MFTTFSPINGSHKPSFTTSTHSELLLVESETVTTISLVSLPVIFNGAPLNMAVTTQEPTGMGEVADNGFTTVVAPAGACPLCSKWNG